MAPVSLFTLILTIFLIVGYIFYKISIRKFDYWKKRNVPFLKPTPFFGNFFKVALFRRGLGLYIADLYKQSQDKFFGVFVYDQPYLIVRDPELLKHILVKDFDYFRDRSVYSNDKIDSMTANMLFFMKGSLWKTLRVKTSPVFTSGKLKNMSPLMEAIGETVKDYIRKGAAANVEEEMKELCARYSMDILATCAFGMDAKCITDKKAPFYQAGSRIFGYSFLNNLRLLSYFINHFLVKVMGLTFLDSHVNEFIRNTLGMTIVEREKNNCKRNDLVDFLVEFKKKDMNGIKFEGDVLLAQAGQFFVAGHETVATTMTFAIYELAFHPEIQAKLRQEITHTLKEHDKLDYGIVYKLPYLDQVVKETLRKYPILPFLDRRCQKDYTLPGTDVVIEAGTPIFIPMYGLHYDEKYFPDPQRFDPDRFSEENKDKFPSTAYIPFGYGPRICIGERFGLAASKLGLAHILSEFEVQTCERTPTVVKYDNRGFTLVPTNKIYVKFVKLPIPAA